MGIEFIPSAQKHSPHIVNGRKPLAYLTFQNDKTMYQRERETEIWNYWIAVKSDYEDHTCFIILSLSLWLFTRVVSNGISWQRFILRTIEYSQLIRICSNRKTAKMKKKKIFGMEIYYGTRILKPAQMGATFTCVPKMQMPGHNFGNLKLEVTSKQHSYTMASISHINICINDYIMYRETRQVHTSSEPGSSSI